MSRHLEKRFRGGVDAESLYLGGLLVALVLVLTLFFEITSESITLWVIRLVTVTVASLAILHSGWRALTTLVHSFVIILLSIFYPPGVVLAAAIVVFIVAVLHEYVYDTLGATIVSAVGVNRVPLDDIDATGKSSVRIGDQHRVRQGDRIIADARVISGSITVTLPGVHPDSPLDMYTLYAGDRVLGGSRCIKGKATVRIGSEPKRSFTHRLVNAVLHRFERFLIYTLQQRVLLELLILLIGVLILTVAGISPVAMAPFILSITLYPIFTVLLYVKAYQLAIERAHGIFSSLPLPSAFYKRRSVLCLGVRSTDMFYTHSIIASYDASTVDERLLWGMLGAVTRYAESPVYRSVYLHSRQFSDAIPDPERLESKGAVGNRGTVSGHDIRLGVREFFTKKTLVTFPPAGRVAPTDTLLAVTVDGHFITYLRVRRELDVRLERILRVAHEHHMTIALPSAIHQELGVSHPALLSDSACAGCTIQFDHEGMFRSKSERRPLVRVRLCDNMHDLQESDLPSATRDALWHMDDLLAYARCSRRLLVGVAVITLVYVVLALVLASEGLLSLPIALGAHLTATLLTAWLIHVRTANLCAILSPHTPRT